jgi:starvation-inducible DNA-binding protein
MKNTGTLKTDELLRRRRAPLATRSDLSAAATRDIAGAINGILADVFALYTKTKNFHWHISGPHFRDYHHLMDEQAEQLFAMTDPIAERVRKLGQPTLKSIGQISLTQRVLDNEADYVEPRDILAELAEDKDAHGSPTRGSRLLQRTSRCSYNQPYRSVDRRNRASGLVSFRGCTSE